MDYHPPWNCYRTLTPDTGKLVLRSNDANQKYVGMNYPITMNVDEQYYTIGFDGINGLTLAGRSGTLEFHSTPN